MASKTVSQQQLEWILVEIMSRARAVIETNRHMDCGDDLGALVEADGIKLDHIAYMGWLADVGLTRMDSCGRHFDGDPVKWLLSPAATKALTVEEVQHG